MAKPLRPHQLIESANSCARAAKHEDGNGRADLNSERAKKKMRVRI
jgi:hypothetical protein